MGEATSTDRTDQARPLVTSKALPRYVITALLIRLADEGTRVGLVLFALDRMNSAAVGGLLVAASLVPQVVTAAPWASSVQVHFPSLPPSSHLGSTSLPPPDG